MFELEKPYLLFLLLLLPLLVIAQKKYVKWQHQAKDDFASPKAFKKIIINFNPVLNSKKFYLVIAGLFFIIIALINPKLGYEMEEVQAKGTEIVFCLDVSKSMLCNDIQPSRLEKAKQIMTQCLQNLTTDRIGIMAYAANAHPILPMTTDYSLAKMYIQTLNTDIISSKGTDIQTALKHSSDMFDNPNAAKAIILLSDGEDHENEVSDIISYAKEKGVTIFTIGLGTPKGGTITYFNEYGEPQLKLDEQGNAVITKLNENVLQQIAKETSGNYMLGTQTPIVIQTLQKGLNTLKKSDLKAKQLAQQQSLYQWFLAIGIILLLIEFVLPWFKLDVFKKVKWLTVLFFSIVISAQNKTTGEVEAALKEKKLRQISAKEKDLQNKASYNLGNSIYQIKKYSEAKDKYLKTLANAKSKSDKHKAYHNLGNVFMKEKNYSKAVENYKNALRNNPKDEQTRYNYALAKELLKKNPPPKSDKNKDKQKDKNQQNENNKSNNKDQKKNKQSNNQTKQKKPSSATKQQMNNVLKAIENAEKKVREKVNGQKIPNQTKENERDW